MRRARAIVVAVLLTGAVGCGGGAGELDLSSYTQHERRAIEEAQFILAEIYGLNIDRVTTVDRNDVTPVVVTRVEVDTSEGHRCVYFRNTPVGGGTSESPNPDALYLVSIKGGAVCSEAIYLPEE